MQGLIEAPKPISQKEWEYVPYFVGKAFQYQFIMLDCPGRKPFPLLMP